jgi:hypothetical protein
MVMPSFIDGITVSRVGVCGSVGRVLLASRVDENQVERQGSGRSGQVTSRIDEIRYHLVITIFLFGLDTHPCHVRRPSAGCPNEAPLTFGGTAKQQESSWDVWC